jgi:hypothetical protein
VQVSAAATDASRSFLKGTGLTGGAVGQQASFVLHARDRFDNAATVGGDSFRLTGAAEATGTGGTIATTLTDRRDGMYTIRYTATSAETYVLFLTLAGEPVGMQPHRSPVYVAVLESTGTLSIPRTLAEGVGLTQATAGDITTYTVLPVSRDGFALAQCGVEFVATLSCSPSAEEIDDPLTTPCVASHERTLTTVARTVGLPADTQGVLQESGCYEYTVTYNLTRAGVYTHALTVNFAPIMPPNGALSWPLTLRVYPADTSAAHSRVVDPSAPLLPAKAAAPPLPSGTVLRFCILAMDRFGNAQRYGAGLRSGTHSRVGLLTSQFISLESQSPVCFCCMLIWTALGLFCS